MHRSLPEGADALTGKRGPIRSREIGWREGRYGKRRRVRLLRRPALPRPLRDAVVAVAVGLVAAGVVLSVSFMLLSVHKVPLHYGYGVLLGMWIVGCLLAEPRDRGGLMITCGIAFVWILGTGYLYSVRDQIHLHPHEHNGPAVVAFHREPA